MMNTIFSNEGHVRIVLLITFRSGEKPKEPHGLQTSMDLSFLVFSSSGGRSL
jgi:hypothetical protein